jgi:hypothetical protein
MNWGTKASPISRPAGPRGLSQSKTQKHSQKRVKGLSFRLNSSAYLQTESASSHMKQNQIKTE